MQVAHPLQTETSHATGAFYEVGRVSFDGEFAVRRYFPCSMNDINDAALDEQP
jgi:hypothetical protein